MDPLQSLIRLAAEYGKATGLEEATVSGRVLKGGNRLRDLRAGLSDIGIRRLEAAIQWFSSHWPTDAEWPSDVPRPEPASPQPEQAA